MISKTINILTHPSRIAKSRIRVHTKIDAEPVSKQRPRFVRYSNGQVYTPIKTRDAEDLISWAIKSAHTSLITDDVSNFGIRLVFSQHTNHRRDIDNMAKLVLDACNQVVWKDDRQVIELYAVVLRGQECAYTEICIYLVDGTMANRPKSKCLTCGKEFLTYPSWQKANHYKKYCSRRCYSLGTKAGLDKKCANCGKIIYRAPHRLNAKEFFCSKECKSAFGTVKLQCVQCNKLFTRPRSLNRSGKKYCNELCMQKYYRKHKLNRTSGQCKMCGGSTSKKVYHQCKACYIDAKKFRFKGK